MHFHGTPLAGEYATLDYCVGVWGGCGYGHLVIGGLLGVFYTRLAMVVDGVMLGILRAHCLVSLRKRRPLSWRRSQLTRAVYPVRWRLFTPGYLSWSRLVIAKIGLLRLIITPCIICGVPWTLEI